ncbi:MAG: lysophospholipase [Pseudomonadota bacterium]
MPGLVAPHSHQLHAADGTPLHVTDYLLPAHSAHGSVVIMHGLGEHSGRYRRLAQFLAECGMSVRCYDHRGHGRSGGDRGDVINGDAIVEDAQRIVDEFSARFRDAPFLLGHSMGGLFAARFALARLAPLRGLILSSPALAVPMSGTQKLMLSVMHTVAPRLGVPNGLQSKFLSHDMAVVAAYRADPLVHNKISARLLRSMLSSIDYCMAQAHTLSVPTLMLVAGEDHLVDLEGSKQFFAKLPPALAQFEQFDGFYHELFNEVDAARPLAQLKRWLLAQEDAARVRY